MISLRTAQADDIAAVMAVMDAAFDPVFGEAWTRGQCLAILSLPGTWLVLAEATEGRPAGFALVRAILDEAELLLLAVHPADRGAGLGARLLERVVADARARDVATLHLEMRAGNEAARLYARAGFRTVGRRPRYYRGRDGLARDAVTLSRRLAPI